MMKPGIGSYDRFKELFDRYSQEAGKEQYLIPYFIAAHPGTTDEDMLNLALWLKRNGFRAGSGAGVPAVADGERDGDVSHAARTRCARSRRRRRCTSPKGPQSAAVCTRRSCAITIRATGRSLREALRRMGRADLIGGRQQQLIPLHQPAVPDAAYKTGSERRSSSSAGARPFRTQQTVDRPRNPRKGSDRARGRDRPGR